MTKLERTLGPEQGMLHKETSEELEARVGKILENMATDEEPVLICEELNDHFVICDGNHTFEALKQLGRENAWVISWNDSRIHKELASNR